MFQPKNWRVQTEMQEDLDHAAQLTDEYDVLRHDFEELQEAHEKVQVGWNI